MGLEYKESCMQLEKAYDLLTRTKVKMAYIDQNFEKIFDDLDDYQALKQYYSLEIKYASLRCSQIIDSDETINRLADRFIEWQSTMDISDKIKALEKDLKQTEMAIQNAMEVIDSGFVTDSLKSHLMELETQKKAKEKVLSEALLEQPDIDRDIILWFFHRFRTGDRNGIMWKITLIDMFLKAVYVYDDRIHLDLNFSDYNSRNSIDIVEKAASDGVLLNSPQSSKLTTPALPKRDKHFAYLFLIILLLFRYNPPAGYDSYNDICRNRAKTA